LARCQEKPDRCCAERCYDELENAQRPAGRRHFVTTFDSGGHLDYTMRCAKNAVADCNAENMALNNEDWKNISKKIDAAIKQAIADLRPTGRAHAVLKLRQIGTLANIIAIFVTMFGITLSAVYVSVAHSKEETQFRTRTDDRLTAIEVSILTLRTARAADNPLNPKNQAEAKSILAVARKSAIPLPASAIQEAGERFIDVARENLKAWDVATEFVNYRSASTAWHDDVTKALRTKGYPWCFSKLPEDPGISMSSDRKTLTFHGPMVYESCVMQLDDPGSAFQLRAVPGGLIFKRCLIKYSGGEVVVPGQYDTCVFELSPRKLPSVGGTMLAKAILNSPDSVARVDTVRSIGVVPHT